jgi:hypothetical protein
MDETTAAPEATAAPETPPQETAEVLEANTPEEAKPAAKTFTQEELDAIVSKRLAREQRKWERERGQQPEPQPQKDIPPVEQFESPEAYADALAEKKARELVAQRDAQRHQAQVLEAYQEREEQAREKYDDFEQVAYNPKLPITAVMAETIQASDAGPDVAYYLGSNPKEADRISRLTPFLQAKEIGKIEAKLAADPPVKRTTTAPQPITPVSARTTGSPAYDTTDPRSIKQMTTSQWIEAERQRQIRKLQAQNRI